MRQTAAFAMLPRRQSYIDFERLCSLGLNDELFLVPSRQQPSTGE